MAKEKKVAVKEKNEKVNFFSKIVNFFHGVKVESKRIHWTTKKDLVKYSIATFIFVLFFSIFFYVIDVLFALLHSLLG